jgi:hypothetical protein
MAARGLDQLSKLTSLVSSQEQYIQQKKSLREQDQQLDKQMASIQKSIDKLERTQSSVLADVGCESIEHLLQQLEVKHQHETLVKQVAEFSDRIVAIVGGSVPYETIARLLDSQGAHDLEKRWEAIGQRTQQAEQRVSQLLQRQGELAQEMKSLASQTRLSEAKLELACIENQLKACSRHWQTLAVTTSLLDKVCEVYETERQPETLREASAFLTQLTEGKYTRIWTPLGKNQLRIDNAKGQSLPLEVLSRGTREAVFIALRLSLAAAYARRGVTIPLVLDDVLVNFDAIRAESAARVLRDFASLGHQVVMFTCHEHIMRIFQKIGVEVRALPPQGQPGEAEVYYAEPEPIAIPEPITIQAPTKAAPEPEIEYEEAEEVEEVEYEVDEEEYVELEQQEEPEPVVEPEPVAVFQAVAAKPEPVVIKEEPKPVLIEPPSVEVPRPRKRRPQVRRVVVVEQQPEIDWLWYEQPEKLNEEWVTPKDSADESPPPNDLWWQHHERQVSPK